MGKALPPTLASVNVEVSRQSQNGDLLRHYRKPRPSRMQNTLQPWVLFVPRISPFWNSLRICNFSAVS